MRITVDRDKCVSAGNCVAHAPTVFDQDDGDGSVVLLNADPSPDQFDDVRQAAAACPAMAIEVED